MGYLLNEVMICRTYIYITQVAVNGQYYQIVAPPDAFPGKMFVALFPIV